MEVNLWVWLWPPFCFHFVLAPFGKTTRTSSFSWHGGRNGAAPEIQECNEMGTDSGDAYFCKHAGNSPLDLTSGSWLFSALIFFLSPSTLSSVFPYLSEKRGFPKHRLGEGPGNIKLEIANSFSKHLFPHHQNTRSGSFRGSHYIMHWLASCFCFCHSKARAEALDFCTGKY